MASKLLDQLRGGDRRSIGVSNEVVAAVLREPDRFDELFDCLRAQDEIVRMRAADAIEKITRDRPELLEPNKAVPLNETARLEQQEIRWHVAQLIPRLTLEPSERETAIEILTLYLHDKSRIVRAFALEALGRLSEGDDRLKAWLEPRLKEAIAAGPPSVRAKARRVLRELEQPAR
jgi:hypothetical protein